MSYDFCTSRECNLCLLVPSGNNKNNVSNAPPEIKETVIRNKALRKCSGCQLVVYCGPEHQKMDWTFHRVFCRAVQRVLKTFKADHPFTLHYEPTCSIDIEKAISVFKHLLRTVLQRPLKFYEEELTSFPAYCVTCYSFRRPEYICSNCRAVSYCSIEHAKIHEPIHEKTCNLLQIYNCIYKLETDWNVPFHGFLTRVPNLRSTDLIGAWQYATKTFVPQIPVSSLQNYQLFSFIADFSCIATLCYALSYVKMESFQKSKEFIVFVIGATYEQNLWFREVHTRFFFLQFPFIANLCLYYIGPETDKPTGCNKQNYLFMGVKRTVHHITYRGLFEDFMHCHVLHPSFIIAFNCGFSEHVPFVPIQGEESPNTWYGGLREVILTHETPIAFTSYTRTESEADFAEFLKVTRASDEKLCIDVERIFKASQNPYRDLRPFRNWQISDEDGIYYRNGYIQAVKTFVRK